MFQAMDSVRRRALEMRNEAVSSAPNHKSGHTKDPNFPHPNGGVDMGGGIGIGWNYDGYALPGFDIAGVATTAGTGSNL
jgi:hypothetical protein